MAESQNGKSRSELKKRLRQDKKNEKRRDNRSKNPKSGALHYGPYYKKKVNHSGRSMPKKKVNKEDYVLEERIMEEPTADMYNMEINFGESSTSNSTSPAKTLENLLKELEWDNLMIQLEEEEAAFDKEESDFLSKIENDDERWKKYMDNIESQWEQNRGHMLKTKIESMSYDAQFCSFCKKKNDSFVRCMTCVQHFCADCDIEFHSRFSLHNRSTLLDGSILFLGPTKFLSRNNEGYKIIQKDVPLRLFEPQCCNRCGFNGQPMELHGGNKHIVVVTKDGPLLIKSAAFKCCNPGCGVFREANAPEYANSGFWPASANGSTYYVAENLLSFWSKMKHEMPSTSEGKFVKSLSAMSAEKGLYKKSLNVNLFNTASREYENMMHKLDKLVKRDFTKCRVCEFSMLFVHADGNFKLYRLDSAKDRNGKSLYSDEMIVSDDELFAHIQKIDKVKPPTKGSSRCGLSTFKAARSDASHFKGLDESGIVMMCCRHGVILRAGNMYQGETYRHTHYLHNFASKLGAKFFCNDVVCHYWPFNVDVAEKLPEFKGTVNGMQPFLSPVHGRGHGWYCRVLFNGQWKKGAGATLGEEMEQCFATMSRYGSVTKHMSKPHRRDHLTAAMLYWNKGKESKMAAFLRSRLIKAVDKAKELAKLLEETLMQRGLSKNHLDMLLMGIKVQAMLVKDRRLSKTWPGNALQNELEGLVLSNRILQERIQKFADGPKARAANRQIMRANKERIDRVVLILKKEHSIIVTDEALQTLIFPWHEVSGDVGEHEVSVSQDYELIQIWQQQSRFEEEITLCQREMIHFLTSLKNTQSSLLKEEITLKNESSLADRGKAVLLKTERLRVTSLLKQSAKRFDLNLNHDQPTPDDGVDFELEDQILDVLGDDASWTDDDEL